MGSNEVMNSVQAILSQRTRWPQKNWLELQSLRDHKNSTSYYHHTYLLTYQILCSFLSVHFCMYYPHSYLKPNSPCETQNPTPIALEHFPTLSWLIGLRNRFHQHIIMLLYFSILRKTILLFLLPPLNTFFVPPCRKKEKQEANQDTIKLAKFLSLEHTKGWKAYEKKKISCTVCWV